MLSLSNSLTLSFKPLTLCLPNYKCQRKPHKTHHTDPLCVVHVGKQVGHNHVCCYRVVVLLPVWSRSFLGSHNTAVASRNKENAFLVHAKSCFLIQWLPELLCCNSKQANLIDNVIPCWQLSWSVWVNCNKSTAPAGFPSLWDACVDVQHSRIRFSRDRVKLGEWLITLRWAWWTQVFSEVQAPAHSSCLPSMQAQTFPTQFFYLETGLRALTKTLLI